MESAIGYHHVQQPSIYAVKSDGLFDLFVAKHTVDISLKRQLSSRNGFMIPREKLSHLSFPVAGQKEVRNYHCLHDFRVRDGWSVPIRLFVI